MSFFKSSTSEYVYLLIDIGSGSLTVSFVLYKEKDVPVFLHTVSKNFVITDKPDSSKLFENMARVLDESLEEGIKKSATHKYWVSSGGIISGTVISFSSPWFVPKTKHIEIIKKEPFVVTDSFLNEVITAEEKIFKNEIANTTESSDSFDVIEKSMVHMKINGYILDNFVGQKTNIFDAFLCMSIISSSVMNKIYSIILKHTHIPKEKIISHTFPVVSFSVIRDVYSNYSNFLIIDTTSEVTDITLIENDIISQTSSFPSGKNFIVRQIAKYFNIGTEIAESNFSLFINGKLDNETSLKMEEVLSNVEKEWSIYFEKSIEEVSMGRPVPSKAYITSDRDVAELYIKFLKLPKSDSTSAFRKNSNITYIENKLFAQLYKNDSITVPNEFIVMLAIFCKKILHRK